MGRVVYTTGKGRIGDSRSDVSGTAPKGDGVVRVRREVKGRKGKTVTTVSGIPLATGELKQLASELKRKCGSGGTVREGLLEVQGDHVELLMKELSARGYTVKKAGG
jgi:translation initiation factor 1